jgi:hypothetical protein
MSRLGTAFRAGLAASLATFASLALLSVAGCDGEGNARPAPTPSAGGAGGQGGAGGAGGVAQGGGGSAPTPTVKRTVEQRHPLGNVQAAENLLWDGDFELSSPFADQYPWFQGPPFGFGGLDVRLGAACRSGLKCLSLKKKKAALAMGVGSTAPALSASVHVKLLGETKLCAEVTAALTTLSPGSPDPDVGLAMEAEVPDASGTCHYAATVGGRADKVWLYVENDTDGDVLVDDAVVLRAEATSTVKSLAAPLSGPALARLAAAKDDVRKLPKQLSSGREALRGLEAWRGRTGP